MLQFLREREQDGKAFVFKYTNNNGNTKTHKINKVNYISDNERWVELFVGQKIFKFTIKKWKI